MRYSCPAWQCENIFASRRKIALALPVHPALPGEGFFVPIRPETVPIDAGLAGLYNLSCGSPPPIIGRQRKKTVACHPARAEWGVIISSLTGNFSLGRWYISLRHFGLCLEPLALSQALCLSCYTCTIRRSEPSGCNRRLAGDWD